MGRVWELVCSFFRSTQLATLPPPRLPGRHPACCLLRLAGVPRLRNGSMENVVLFMNLANAGAPGQGHRWGGPARSRPPNRTPEVPRTSHRARPSHPGQSQGRRSTCFVVIVRRSMVHPSTDRPSRSPCAFGLDKQDRSIKPRLVVPIVAEKIQQVRRSHRHLDDHGIPNGYSIAPLRFALQDAIRRHVTCRLSIW